MTVVGIVDELLGLVDQLLANFVGITSPVVVTSANGDGQLSLYQTIPSTTAKGNALTGALADILTSGAQLADLILQALVGFPPEAAAGPSTTL